jgi:hypothetical protein
MARFVRRGSFQRRNSDCRSQGMDSRNDIRQPGSAVKRPVLFHSVFKHAKTCVAGAESLFRCMSNPKKLAKLVR